MDETKYELRPIGWVESSIINRSDAPRQADEGAPDVWLNLRRELLPAMGRLRVGDRVIVLTWLHQADRSVLEVHPRRDPERPLTGVFATRSPDRPNPIGIHEVQILAIDGRRIHVSALEAIDGTPVVDIKPLLGPIGER